MKPNQKIVTIKLKKTRKTEENNAKKKPYCGISNE